MNGGGSHGGFNNGMNPFPYSNSMHNNMYMPNSNSYRSNDRSSRQVQQQAFNRNRNIRRGRRLSRRGKLKFFCLLVMEHPGTRNLDSTQVTIKTSIYMIIGRTVNQNQSKNGLEAS